MFVVLIVLTILAAVLLVGVVLIQKSKGGGLSSAFAGNNQLLGVRRTNTFIEKATWYLAGIICILSILASFCMPPALSSTESRVKGKPQTEQVVEGGNFDTQAPAAELPAAPEVPAAE